MSRRSGAGQRPVTEVLTADNGRVDRVAERPRGVEIKRAATSTFKPAAWARMTHKIFRGVEDDVWHSTVAERVVRAEHRTAAVP